MKKMFVYNIVWFLSLPVLFAQDYSESFKTLYSTVFNGDTIAEMNLDAVSVVRYKFNSTHDEWEYNNTKRRVEKVKPYYDIALKVLIDLEEKEQNSKKRAFNKYKRKTKKELMKKFEKELRQLTRSEGKILVKMINRNTGKNFNDLIKEYNSPIKVWVYNIAAKKYGYNLKEEYQPENEDNKFIEMALKALNY